MPVHREHLEIVCGIPVSREDFLEDIRRACVHRSASTWYESWCEWRREPGAPIPEPDECAEEYFRSGTGELALLHHFLKEAAGRAVRVEPSASRSQLMSPCKRGRVFVVLTHHALGVGLEFRDGFMPANEFVQMIAERRYEEYVIVTCHGADEGQIGDKLRQVLGSGADTIRITSGLGGLRPGLWTAALLLAFRLLPKDSVHEAVAEAWDRLRQAKEMSIKVANPGER